MAVQTLGVITVTAGVRVRATTTRKPCQAFMVQAHPSNTAIGACGDSTLVYSTNTGVWGWVGIPSSTGVVIPAFSSRHSYAPGAFNLADLYLDCQAGTQKFVVTYIE